MKILIQIWQRSVRGVGGTGEHCSEGSKLVHFVLERTVAHRVSNRGTYREKAFRGMWVVNWNKSPD